MNLRQKIKKAKVELKYVKETYPDTYPMEMLTKHEKVSELQNIINHKRNYNRFYEWNEEYKIDLNKLTYISFAVGYEEKMVLTTKNGRVLSPKEIKSFNELALKKFLEIGKEVGEKEEIRCDWKIKNRVTYHFFYSNDRTKGKKLHKQELCHQFYGSDELHGLNIKGENSNE